MRYLIVDKETYNNAPYRFVYDTKFKTFVIVHKGTSEGWKNAKFVDENFYVYFPGHAATIRESDTLPNWKAKPNATSNRFNNRKTQSVH